ncbi:MAG TPA: hypothetical protein DEQ38_00845 [Elusimicrobia bacterium]|nr:MAG: hypothetical protein A2089_09880 [Elusimicrobia bacterium GWD2_63_28]HCC46658.1 hypothetical protein [Elusimicrobiota bacterium]
MIKKNSLLTAVFAAALAQGMPAAAQQLNFDGAAAPASFTEALKAAAPEIVKPEFKTAPDSRGWYKRKVCQVVELNSADGASINRKISLDAAFIRNVCETASAMVNGQYIAASNCHDETDWYTAYVQLVIHARQLRQFDKERIEVCYDFQSQKGTFALRQTPFEYTFRDKNNSWEYSIELFPGARRPQAPDASLAELGGFSYDDVRGEFTLTIRNRFTGEYDGRKIHIGAELVQDKFFDSSRGTKFFEFPLDWRRQDFKIVFKESDFPSDKDAGDFRAKAKKFFMNWGFKIKGEGFTEDYQEKGKTETLQVLQ